MCVCDIMSSCQSALSWMQILVLVFTNSSLLWNILQPLLIFSSGHPTFLPFFPHWAHPKLGFFKIISVIYAFVCVSHLFDWRAEADGAIALASFYQRNGVVIVCPWNGDIMSLLLFFFLFAQSNAGETVSHSSRSLHLNSLYICFWFVNPLAVLHTNTCCLKCKCRYLFVPEITVNWTYTLKSVSVHVG